MYLWVAGNRNLEPNTFVEFKCYITEHKDFKGTSKYFRKTSIKDMVNQNMLQLPYHFLSETCTINLLEKRQNEIFLNNMQNHPLFKSLLHISLEVLSFKFVIKTGAIPKLMK